MNAENEHSPAVPVNEPGAIDDMVADLGLDLAASDQLRSTLTDIRGLAKDVPVASPDVVAMLQGATPLGRSSRQRLAVAAAVGALAFGGASAAAATNNLPDPIQEVVANVTGAPHPSDDRPGVKPVKPTDAPSDAPGQLKDKPAKADHDNSDAPGQIQKGTKPDTASDGPAKPADPGSHGQARADDVQASHTKGDNKKDKPAKEKKPKKAGHPDKSDRTDEQGLDNDDNGGGGNPNHR
jgi:hypothetical protein